MTATIEQTQRELPRMVELARRGEEVLITENGLAVARITAAARPQPGIPWSERRQAWLDRLDALRASTGTGQSGPSIQEILDADRTAR